MQTQMHVRLINAALDTFTNPDGEEHFVLRGVLDPDTLGGIQAAEYQREILSGSKTNKLVAAFETSTVPDIELGMRGEKYQVRNAGKPDEVYILLDPVFVIDGLQRTTAAKHLIQTKPGSKPRVGAVVHIGTDFDWERKRFRILNQERTKLSTNVLLRNLQTEQPGIEMIFKLCADKDFVLANRVQWEQRQARNELISALTLCKTLGVLHSRFGPGRHANSDELAAAISKTMDIVGRTTMRDNAKTFFDFIDEAWGIRRIVFAEGASYIKTSFLLTLADVFTHHKDFWRGTRLSIETDLRRKIAKFPVSDPNISNLASSGGKSGAILYAIMINHINSGKRSRRLTKDVVDNERVPTTESEPTSAAA